MNEPRRGRLVHAVAGRVRIRLERAELTDELCRQLGEALERMPGVEQARVNARTGSVVVQYDPDRLDAESLAALARAADVLALDASLPDAVAASPPLSLTSESVRRTFSEVNARLSELSARRWDLRSVVPFAFGAFALRQFIRDFGNWGSAPWYVLAWYAFDSFWKLNQNPPNAPDPEPPDARAPLS